MSDAGDKSEDASSQKLKKAKKEGQTAKAKDFSSAVALIMCVIYYSTQISEIKLDIVQIFGVAYNFTVHDIQSTDYSLMLLGKALFIMIKIFAPLMLIKFIMVALSTIMVSGLQMNFSLIAPKFNKISPISGIKRIFSMNTIMEFLKSVLKITIIFAILYYMLSNNFGIIGGLVRTSFRTVMDMSTGILIQMVFMLVAVIVIFGIIDMPYQKYSFKKQMKMTKEEVKQEHKEQEGRPEVKARIRQIQMQNARRSINKSVPTADVILMNPSHYAVALKYDITRAEAPFVVAKGIDEVAFYIRSIGVKNQVEVLEVPALARSIYHTTQVDQMIPNQLFVAVAHILNYVKQLQAWKNGTHMKPNSLPSFTIPEELRY
ncbi:MAG: flagellar biosynthesis protein FlhB [Vibrio sp.]